MDAALGDAISQVSPKIFKQHSEVIPSWLRLSAFECTVRLSCIETRRKFNDQKCVITTLSLRENLHVHVVVFQASYHFYWAFFN